MKKLFRFFVFGLGLLLASCSDDIQEDITLEQRPMEASGEDEDDPIIIEDDKD